MLKCWYTEYYFFCIKLPTDSFCNWDSRIDQATCESPPPWFSSDFCGDFPYVTGYEISEPLPSSFLIVWSIVLDILTCLLFQAASTFTTRTAQWQVVHAVRQQVASILTGRTYRALRRYDLTLNCTPRAIAALNTIALLADPVSIELLLSSVHNSDILRAECPVPFA